MSSVVTSVFHTHSGAGRYSADGVWNWERICWKLVSMVSFVWQALSMVFCFYSQQMSVTGMPSRKAIFFIFDATWPMPMAQWCAGPAMLQRRMNSLTPMGKR